jgi:hypothetical protein
MDSLEMKLRHNPIKTDRWACGHVALFLLDELWKEDKPETICKEADGALSQTVTILTFGVVIQLQRSGRLEMYGRPARQRPRDVDKTQWMSTEKTRCP